MLHRAVFGSFERFIGLADRALRRPLPALAGAAAGGGRADRLRGQRLRRGGGRGARAAAGLRAEADLRNEKINYKVREHSLAKVPVILAVGNREVEDRTVSLRRLGETGSRVAGLDAVVAELVAEATPPDLRAM